ncbi:hypothetical protein BDM02DRAFT_3189904 [Thelephora ganbajun]|uniref:Uncharacterized protein n=1 Tax=Thelephora ganbajun TaxID=370292 RepID=A0ACB6Z6J5_THEGA|nr:hypothetical protein BDM02DRAFT_3189904 [Thelephora ganbajun]
MAPASSFLISGIFFLSDGTRAANPSYYTHYLSALDFVDTDQFINISIQKYTPPSEPLYVDETIVFLVAKAVLLPGEDSMLDTIHCTPFQLPWEDFKSCLPSIPTHTALVTGTISTINNVGSTHSFTVNVFEYVCDERCRFTIRFQFEADSGRWKNLCLPPTGSTIIATGAFKGTADDGCSEPILTLLDVSFGTPEMVSASPTCTIGHRRVENKRSLLSSPPSPSQSTAEVSDNVAGIAASASKWPIEEVEEIKESAPQRKLRVVSILSCITYPDIYLK